MCKHDHYERYIYNAVGSCWRTGYEERKDPAARLISRGVRFTFLCVKRSPHGFFIECSWVLTLTRVISCGRFREVPQDVSEHLFSTLIKSSQQVSFILSHSAPLLLKNCNWKIHCQIIVFRRANFHYQFAVGERTLRNFACHWRFGRKWNKIQERKTIIIILIWKKINSYQITTSDEVYS